MAILIRNRRDVPTLPTRSLTTIARTICAASGCPDAELSVVIVDDEEIHALNKTWRGKDKPTDVLSFPQAGAAGGVAPQVLGDVVVSGETAARQAKERGHSLRAELEQLLVHGILHLLGHDHVRGGAQARRMKREEQRILALVRKRQDA